MRSKLSTLALLLWLTGCVPIPFGIPKGTPDHPIITSGVFTLSNGARLPYRLYPAQGPVQAVVLALHGYTDSRDGWLILAKSLNAAGITVYAPDQSGFGATANRGHWPGTAVLLAEARFMVAQLRAQYPDTKLVLMGESMGGAEAILLGASPHPPPVDEYVISAPAVWGGDALNPAYHMAMKLAEIFVPAKRLTGNAAHVRASDNEAAFIAFGEDPLTIHAPSVDNVAKLVALMGDAQAACGQFHQPALILYGGHDQLIPAEAMRKCWAQIPQTAPVVLAYYPPDYHLIERDLERATPTDDIIGYILGQGVQSEAPSAATVFLAGG